MPATEETLYRLQVVVDLEGTVPKLDSVLQTIKGRLAGIEEIRDIRFVTLPSPNPLEKKKVYFVSGVWPGRRRWNDPSRPFREYNRALRQMMWHRENNHYGDHTEWIIRKASLILHPESIPSPDRSVPPLRNLPLEHLGLTRYRALLREGIWNVEELAGCSRRYLLTIREIGPSIIAQIETRLGALGLKLKEEKP